MRNEAGLTLTEALVCLCLLSMASAGALRLSGVVSSATARSETRVAALMAAREVLCRERSRARSLENPRGDEPREDERTVRVTVGERTYVVTVQRKERGGCRGLWDWRVTAVPSGGEAGAAVELASSSFDPF